MVIAVSTTPEMSSLVLSKISESRSESGSGITLSKSGLPTPMKIAEWMAAGIAVVSPLELLESLIKDVCASSKASKSDGVNGVGFGLISGAERSLLTEEVRGSSQFLFPGTFASLIL